MYYGIPVLQVLAGSIATGCDTPESDRDVLGIFAAPTEDILTFGSQMTTSVSKVGDDDVTWWEIRHALNLLLKGNFNALPLLYSDHILFNTDEGKAIRDRKSAFISVKFVKSMLGFAKDQTLRFLEGRKLKNSSPEKALACVYRELTVARHLLSSTADDFSLPLLVWEREYFLSIKQGERDLQEVAKDLNFKRTLTEGMLESPLEHHLPLEPSYPVIKELLRVTRQSVPMQGNSSLWDSLGRGES